MGHLIGVIKIVAAAPARVVLMLKLLRDPEVPLRHKLIFGAAVAAAVGIALAPGIDLTQLVPLVGVPEDMILGTAVMALFFRIAPPDVVARHEREIASTGIVRWLPFLARRSLKQIERDEHRRLERKAIDDAKTKKTRIIDSSRVERSNDGPNLTLPPRRISGSDRGLV